MLLPAKGLRQSFSAVASAFTFYPESETPKQAEKEQTVASSLLEAGDEGLQDLQEDMLRLQGNIFGFAPAPTPSEPEIPIPKRSQKSVVRPRSPQKVPTLNIKLPPVWDLQQGQASGKSRFNVRCDLPCCCFFSASSRLCLPCRLSKCEQMIQWRTAASTSGQHGGEQLPGKWWHVLVQHVLPRGVRSLGTINGKGSPLVSPPTLPQRRSR